ncbi:MAG: hypothetical protein KGI97_03465 [Alphaproteobacteria bacterium]|nr:hypothetical protein [Alphaproteobacteria bacterium]
MTAVGALQKIVNRFLCFLLIDCLLAGCAASAPVLKPVEVDIPVAVPCKADAPRAPDFALSHVGAADDVFAKTRAALTEIDQRKGYEAALRAQAETCHS